MVSIIFTKEFEKTFKKIKDHNFKTKVKTQIKKILENPKVGKPLKYSFKGERTIYVKPYRILYAYTNNQIILLKIVHRDLAYK